MSQYPSRRRRRLGDDVVALITQARLQHEFLGEPGASLARAGHHVRVATETSQRVCRDIIGVPHVVKTKRRHPKQLKPFEKERPFDSVQVDQGRITDHPREWAALESEPGRPFERDSSQPITFAAHREMSYYLNYAAELFRQEPSGIALKATDTLKTEYSNLSAIVHPSDMLTIELPIPPIDSPTNAKLNQLMERHRAVCWACASLRQPIRDPL